MKIAHISDFHLRLHLPGRSAVDQRLSRSIPQLLPQALEAIAAQKPDLLVVTGDLIDHPFEAMDSEENRRLGRLDLEWCAQAWRDFPCPVTVLYGNHDHPGLFKEVFVDQKIDQAVGPYRVLSFWDEEGESHVPTRQGAQWLRFESVLNDADPRPQIHLQHYLVAPRRDEGYPHTYDAKLELQQRIAAAGKVRLVLSGHYHPGEKLFEKQGTYYGVAPAFCQKPHLYRIYTLGGEKISCQEFSLE
jgi:3',5'-cyclic-AMP phosphodiesterase